MRADPGGTSSGSASPLRDKAGVTPLAGRPGVTSSVILIGISLALASLCLVSSTITDDSIIVRRSPIRSQMPLSRLRELRATQDAMAAPALSLDRIEIRTDRGL